MADAVRTPAGKLCYSKNKHTEMLLFVSRNLKDCFEANESASASTLPRVFKYLNVKFQVLSKVCFFYCAICE